MASGGSGWAFDDIDIDFNDERTPHPNRTGIDYITIILSSKQ